MKSKGEQKRDEGKTGKKQGGKAQERTPHSTRFGLHKAANIDDVGFRSSRM
jgi:hypothetical protein